MALPPFYDRMLPILKLASNGGEQSARKIKEPLAKEFQLSKEEQINGCRTAHILFLEIELIGH